MRIVTRFTSLFAAVLLFTPCALAQVTVTGADLLSTVGEYQLISSESSDTGIAVDVGSAGTNQSWDFTALSPSEFSFTRAFLTGSQTPFAAEFPTSNFVFASFFMEDTVSIEEYSFNFVDNTEIRELGDASVFGDTSFVEVAAIPQSIALPVALNSSWLDLERDTLDLGGGNFFLSIDSTTNVADGWGTAQTAIGAVDVVRLRADSYEISQTFSGGTRIASDTTRQIEYQWISPQHFVVVSINGMEDDTNPNFTMAADVSVVSAITTGIETPEASEASIIQGVYPNPTSSVVEIDIDSPGRVIDVAIYNVVGQRVATLSTPAAGKSKLSWDGASSGGVSVSPGVYFVRVHVDAGIQTRKFVLLK